MSQSQTPDAGRIDVQFHFSPPFYNSLVKASGHISADRWGVEAALDYMDRNGVATGILSVSTPSVDFLPREDSVAMARRLNEAAAEIVRDHPRRFGSFATLPMLDVEASLAELVYCLDDLKMDGVCMMSNAAGRYLGHESFAPLFGALNQRKAVVFIHPTDPVTTEEIQMAGVAEWPFDTTRAAVDLIYSGTLRRCPDIRFILAHAGGALPMVASRVEQMANFYSTVQPPVSFEEAEAQIASFYYDLALSAHDNTIGALRGVSDMQHVLFACDWPFAPVGAVALNVNGYQSLSLSSDERQAIDRGNAEKLFPRLYQQ